MNNNSLSPIEIYVQKALKLLMFLITLCGICACSAFTIMKLLGWYEDVSWTALIIFDAMDVSYFFLGQIFTKICLTPEGSLVRKNIAITKIIVGSLIIVQWNFITYMIPSSDFWAYSSLFIIVAMFFLDHKYVLCIEGGLGISMIIGGILKGDVLGAVQDKYYLPNTFLRIILVVLVFLNEWFITFFISKLLVKPIEQISDFDVLTGLHNRRMLYKYVDERITKNRETGRSVTLLMCDIDNFKNVNDTYGHDFGDRVLKSVAEEIEKTIGKNDIAFRYGGEEFLVMIDAESKFALMIAESIRKAIENKTISFEDKSLKVTITIGAAVSDENIGVDALISKADDLLYVGKTSGKNKVVSE